VEEKARPAKQSAPQAAAGQIAAKKKSMIKSMFKAVRGMGGGSAKKKKAGE
jgi:hypothetical protein